MYQTKTLIRQKVIINPKDLRHDRRAKINLARRKRKCRRVQGIFRIEISAPNQNIDSAKGGHKS